MSRIVRFHETGGPDVLKIEDVRDEAPGPGEVLLRVDAVGLNRAEVKLRQGAYAFEPAFPCRIGVESAGEVLAVGPDVNKVSSGDRVASVPYAVADRYGNWLDLTNRYGVYGETALVKAAALWRYPDTLDPVQAAASPCQYLTAWGALVDHARVVADDIVLVTAASSSAGLAGLQIARDIGATTIAATRTQAKAEALRDAGADHVVAHAEEDLVARVMDITDGRGATVTYDPIGGAMMASLVEASAPEARIVNYGDLDPEPIHFHALVALKKRLGIKFHSLYDTSRRPEALRRAAAEVGSRLSDGRLRPVIDTVFDGLDRIRDAHRRMESNEQFGKIVVDVRAG